MGKFIEINEHLIDMDEIRTVYFKINDDEHNDISFYITFIDNTQIDLSTNRFLDNPYEHSRNNIAGHKKLKEYLLQKEP